MAKGNKGKRTGSIIELADGRYEVRKRYIGPKGQPLSKKRRADSPREAQKALREIEREIEDELNGKIQGPKREFTFADLAELFEAKYLVAPRYAGKEKVSGMRSYKNRASELRRLRAHFDKFKLVKITYDDLGEYMAARLATPKRGGRDRKVTGPNRELKLMRRMLNVAMHQRPTPWLISNPFEHGDPIVKPSTEEKRSRILTFDEEKRLYTAAKESKSKELAFALTMALETGMRLGEQFALTDAAIDLPGRVLWATSYKGKGGRLKVRPVPITTILAAAIEAHNKIRSPESPRLFAGQNPRTAFENLRTRAGVEDLHWHDLRHTAITRMVHFYKMQPIEVMKIVGHSNWATFYEVYVNVDADIARNIGRGIDKARAALDELIAAEAAKPSPAPELVIESEGVN